MFVLCGGLSQWWIEDLEKGVSICSGLGQGEANMRAAAKQAAISCVGQKNGVIARA